MREIKFRAWHEERMYYASMCEYLSGYGLMFDRFLRPEALMQYTGLKDSDGVEIYEGDIVGLSRYDIYQVVWDDSGFFGFQELPKEYAHASQCDREGWAQFKVIGNIHENKELSEAGDEG